MHCGFAEPIFDEEPDAFATTSYECVHGLGFSLIEKHLQMIDLLPGLQSIVHHLVISTRDCVVSRDESSGRLVESSFSTGEFADDGLIGLHCRVLVIIRVQASS